MDACCGCGCMWLPVQLCLILSMSFVLSVYSRVHVLVFVCDSVCLCMRLCVCLYGCIVCASALHPLCMCVLGYTYSCVYVGMCAFSYVCVCMYVRMSCMYISMDLCTHAVCCVFIYVGKNRLYASMCTCIARHSACLCLSVFVRYAIKFRRA